MGRVQDHNREVIYNAQHRAMEMQTFPSRLEERMKDYLDVYEIHYEFQKIFYIYADDGWIIRYYIADFYIPDKGIIIEVDGKKYHEHHEQHDKERTKAIQSQYPYVKVLRYTWDDMADYKKMQDLILMVQ